MAKKKTGWIQREGKLGGPGYTKKTVATRHRILARVVKEYGYRSALGSIMALERSTHISATVRKVLVADRNWLRETYGAASRKKPAKKPAARKPAARKTTARRVPSVARRIRRTRTASENKALITSRRSAHDRQTPGYAEWRKQQPKQRRGWTPDGDLVDLNTGRPMKLGDDYRQEYARLTGGRLFSRRGTTRRNGLPDCGLHGIPMHGGSCVACLYEADIL